ncbi:MAG: hypothetical protein ACLU3I_15660 [Acutalibacteraceae bacterium]
MDSGTIRVNGKDVKIRSPKDAVRYGIGYLSEDRKRYGLCLNLSVARQHRSAEPGADLQGPVCS